MPCRMGKAVLEAQPSPRNDRATTKVYAAFAELLDLCSTSCSAAVPWRQLDATRC